MYKYSSRSFFLSNVFIWLIFKVRIPTWWIFHQRDRMLICIWVKENRQPSQHHCTRVAYVVQRVTCLFAAWSGEVSVGGSPPHVPHSPPPAPPAPTLSGDSPRRAGTPPTSISSAAGDSLQGRAVVTSPFSLGREYPFTHIHGQPSQVSSRLALTGCKCSPHCNFLR